MDYKFNIYQKECSRGHGWSDPNLLDKISLIRRGHFMPKYSNEFKLKVIEFYQKENMVHIIGDIEK